MSDFERARKMSAGAAHAGHGGGGGGGDEAAFDVMDPHGGTAHGHGHVIVSAIKMRIVLLVLLTFTAMTVGAAQLEIFLTGQFGIEFPHWVNIIVALSIAVVKSTLVLLYFMQLRYDNPINSIIFVTCLFGLATFLFFAMADLGTRGWIYPEKAGEISKGGQAFSRWKVAGGDAVGGPIAEFEKQKYIERVGLEQYQKEMAEHHAHGHGDSDVHTYRSDAQRSRPRTGLTPDLFSAKPAGDGHEHGGDAGNAGNGAEKKAETKGGH